MDGEVISVERVIAAEPAAIFVLVADAARHPEIDGSGSVRQVKPGAPELLSLGATFGMSMHLGINYSMVSTVIEFEQDRRIAWQSRPTGFAGRFAGGRIWRYVLEPRDGGTWVQESWDVSHDHQRSILKHTGVPGKNERSMAKTLERIEAIVTGS